jgi:hypothetical protein
MAQKIEIRSEVRLLAVLLIQVFVAARGGLDVRLRFGPSPLKLQRFHQQIS